MSTTESRDVSLAIPAKPGFLVLARLALAAVCRLTALGPSDIADLKLAVTEAASDFVAESESSAGVADRVDFSFRLQDSLLIMELSGSPAEEPAVEQDLSHAIISATVDEVTFSSGHTVLVKHL